MLDFEKAFDSIEWNFIFKVLAKYNIGKGFIQWIKTLYADPKIRVKNNGWLTEYISVTRSVKQGCPVSALLFIICIEMLSEQIKNDTKINGIKLKSLINTKRDIVLTTTQFADDIILTLENEESLARALKIINTFTEAAGPKLNLSKSEILGTGIYRIQQKICDIEVKENVRCLGIYIGHDIKFCNDHNWNTKILKLENTLMGWSKRNLTKFGKITIIKTLGLSQLIFSVQNTSMPEGIVKQIEGLLYRFIWNKKEMIKRKTLIAPYEEGGLKMVDTESFFSALKAKWVDRIIYNNAKWNIIGNHLIDNFANDKLLLKIHTPDIKYIQMLPPFYKQMLQCYIKINNISCQKPNTIDELLAQPLWYNKYIFTKIRKKEHPLFISNWLKNGVLYIKDLSFKDGNIDEKLMYKFINNKSNIIIELHEVKMALKPYSHLIKQLSNETRPINISKHKFLSTKKLYNIQIDDIKIIPTYKLIHMCFPNTTSDEIQEALRVKIEYKDDNKLAEFSYKILHNILICGKALNKWTKTPSTCEICEPKEVHDIPHMIYYCTVCNDIWNIINIELCKLHIFDILAYLSHILM